MSDSVGRTNGHSTSQNSISTPLLDGHLRLPLSTPWQRLCNPQMDKRTNIRLRFWHLFLALTSLTIVLVHAVAINPFGQAWDPEDTDTSDVFVTSLTEYMVDVNYVVFCLFWFSILFGVSFMPFMHFAHYTSRPAHVPRVTLAALSVIVDACIFFNSTSTIDIDHDDVEDKRTYIADIVLTCVFVLLVVLDMAISLVCALSGVHQMALVGTNAI
ncbi:hypothetical protein PGQ11_014636 [Apiospora arundinis]|uniref:Uncharacterized protein n=1 Tax=Apiospora arundinis TaxID=335852 RepID=A0ABR2HSV5_9PEZI